MRLPRQRLLHALAFAAAMFILRPSAQAQVAPEQSGKYPGNYPSHWWTPAPEAGKPDWEILPQPPSLAR